MKNQKFLLASLLAIALVAVAWGDTIDKTVGGPELGGPSLDKVHVVSTAVPAPLAAADTYVTAVLPVGAYVLGVGAHGSEDLQPDSVNLVVYKGASVSSCSTAAGATNAAAATGVESYTATGAAVATNTCAYGFSPAAAVTNGTVFLDLLVFEP